MAKLRNLWDAATRKRPGAGLGVSTPGGGTRDPEIDPYVGPQHSGIQPGQQQWGPGTQSWTASFFDSRGRGAWEDAGITNLSDLSDLFDSGSDYLGMDEYDSFYDWFTQLGGDSADMEGTSPIGPGQWSYSQDWEEQQQSYGGGATGGAGDLGTGNVFIGGGMGSSMFGEGLWEQDCSTLGPQYNMQGDCIACCGAQYQEGYSPEGGTIGAESGTGAQSSDPCSQMYTQAGGFDGTQLSWSEFESMYC